MPQRRAAMLTMLPQRGVNGLVRLRVRRQGSWNCYAVNVHYAVFLAIV